MQLAASLGSKGGLPPPQANLLASIIWWSSILACGEEGGDRGGRDWAMVVLVCSALPARGAIFAGHTRVEMCRGERAGM